jgi:hypothetical protein
MKTAKTTNLTGINMKLKWVIEIEIDETWVMDGFNLEDEQDIIDMLQDRLPWAHENELGAKILKAPRKETIKNLQSAY